MGAKGKTAPASASAAVDDLNSEPDDDGDEEYVGGFESHRNFQYGG
jgi:hypothetical protein